MIINDELENSDHNSVIDLKCQMDDGCKQSVTHIDEKGFIYCKEHGDFRRYRMRCRKMRSYELNRLTQGKTLKKY